MEPLPPSQSHALWGEGGRAPAASPPPRVPGVSLTQNRTPPGNANPGASASAADAVWVQGLAAPASWGGGGGSAGRSHKVNSLSHPSALSAPSNSPEPWLLCGEARAQSQGGLPGEPLPLRGAHLPEMDTGTCPPLPQPRSLPPGIQAALHAGTRASAGRAPALLQGLPSDSPGCPSAKSGCREPSSLGMKWLRGAWPGFCKITVISTPSPQPVASRPPTSSQGHE